MSDKTKLQDEELENVTGGRITYTWDGTSGTIGLNGNNRYILLDKDEFVKYWNSEAGNKSDAEILTYLIQNKIAKKPDKNA